MRSGRSGGNRRKFRRFRLYFMFLLCLALIGVVFVDIRIRPMIKTYGNNQAITAATKAVNDAVSSILTQMNVQYDDLVTITKDADGKITSVETNSEIMNSMKSAVSSAIFTELAKQNMQYVTIPLGSLVGGLLTGRGPSVTIKVPMNSTVETTFQSLFEGAGINQTRHQIMLDVKVSVYAVIQGQDTKTEVDTQFSVAENILVGDVPQWAITPTLSGGSAAATTSGDSSN